MKTWRQQIKIMFYNVSQKSFVSAQANVSCKSINELART